LYGHDIDACEDFHPEVKTLIMIDVFMFENGKEV
jgi:hypothetical protein